MTERSPAAGAGARRLAFERLAVRRMPGFEEGGFALEGLSPGVNVIHGPNASGKTTAGRAMRLLLWPGAGGGEASVAAALDLGGERWEIDLDRDRVRHRRQGEPSSPPPLPPADAADRYSLALHELLQPHVRGEELAAAVAREAAGGYDLEAARGAAGARPKPRTPQKARAEYEAALARVREVEEEQRRTAAEADALARLEAELAAAREAGARLERLDAALERLECRERLARAEAALAAFPAGVTRLTGDEGERLARERERLETARADRERAGAALEEERRRLAAAALPDSGLPEGLLDELGERRERLARLEQEIDQRERALAEAKRRRDDARRELGDGADEDKLARLRPQDWRPVVELVRREDDLRRERLELDRRLREETRGLHGRSREPEAGWRARVPALAAALLIAALAAAAGLLVHPGLWALAGISLALVLWIWVEARRERRRRVMLEEERRHVEEAEEALEAGRRDLVDRLGLLPDAGGLPLAALAPLVHSLCRWREARAAVEGAEAALAEARGQHARELEAVRAALDPFGPFGPAEVADAASARGAVEALARRGDAHRRAEEALRRLRGELLRAEEGIERAAGACRELFERLGLPDGEDGALAALLERLDEYRKAAEACREAGVELRLAEERLPADVSLRERDRAALEAEREAAAAAAGRVEELADRLGRLRERIAQAKRQHDLEDALARLETAEEALRAERERDAGAVLAWVLADWVREETRGLRRPAVMARAAALFARITGGAFRLLDPAGAPPVLRAEDARTGTTRDLGELSAGRRLQLLVAVRMGFVEEQERGVRVPLVMDETLANSDDASAAALIEAVLELSREGRQVVYLTAQDDEVSKWRAALEAAGEAGPDWRVIDLAAVRRLEEARRAPRREWRPPEREVPGPGGLGREAYGERLGVPGLDPRSEPGGVHLWYLVEETEVLHGLLARGVERWGELAALVEDAGIDPFGDGAAGARRRAAARARCVRVLFRGWRAGRGRPVDRGALAASGAVSERFLEEVGELAERCRGEAGALLAGLERGEVKGFRRDKIDQLAGYFREEGFLDERPVLGAAELRELAVAELADDLRSEDLTLQALDELLGRLPL